jgi:hypothetical protein
MAVSVQVAVFYTQGYPAPYAYVEYLYFLRLPPFSTPNIVFSNVLISGRN